MADIIRFDDSENDSTAEKITARETGLAVFHWYEQMIQEDPSDPDEDTIKTAEELKELFPHLQNVRDDDDPPTAEQMAAIGKAKVFFPEMEKIVRRSYGNRQKRCAKTRKENLLLLKLMSSADMIVTDALFNRLEDFDSHMEDLGRVYMKVRDLYPDWKRKDPPSEEELSTLQQLQEKADSEKKKTQETFEYMDALLEEIGADREETVNAIKVLLDTGHDNSENEALWDNLTETLTDYGLLPEEGDEDYDAFFRGETPSCTQYVIGRRLLEFFRSAPPDVAEYLFFLDAIETEKNFAEEDARSDAAASGLPEEKAEQYVEMQIADAEEEVRRDYEDMEDEDTLSLFRGLDALEKIVYRLAGESGEEPLIRITASMPEDSIQWHLTFFTLHQKFL